MTDAARDEASGEVAVVPLRTDKGPGRRNAGRRSATVDWTLGPRSPRKGGHRPIADTSASPAGVRSRARRGHSPWPSVPCAVPGIPEARSAAPSTPKWRNRYRVPPYRAHSQRQWGGGLPCRGQPTPASRHKSRPREPAPVIKGTDPFLPLFRLKLAGRHPCLLPRGDRNPSHVRLRRRQRSAFSALQGGRDRTERPFGPTLAHRPLSALYLEVAPH